MRLLSLLVCLSLSGARAEDASPLLDLATSFLQNMAAEGGGGAGGGAGGAGGAGGLGALGGLATSFLQNMAADGGGGAGGGGAGGAGGLGALGGLVGSLLQGDNAKNLGALFGQGGDAGDVLSGLGSLLGGGGGGGGLDPALLGSVLSAVAQQAGDAPAAGRSRREQPAAAAGLDGLLGLAASFMQGKDAAGLAPLIMNAVSSFTDAEAQKRSHDHADHADFLPPYLEKAHLYWDIFINSELGKTVWEKSGLQRALKSFTGPDGKISVEKMMKSFENHSFRRHWIKAAAKYLTDLVVSVAKPEVYQRYLSSGEFLVNSFLEAQGVRGARLNLARPAASLSALANRALQTYLGVHTDVSGYVRPAVEYVQQTLKMAQSVGASLSSRGDYAALTDRVTDTLNLEVIEPALRVHRAYRHAARDPRCAEHLMCLVNKRDHKEQGLPGFAAGLTRLSSLAASAALSYQRGGGFWDLYTAVQSDANCEAAYPADCAAYHDHEQAVTTEVYHSEL